ncbi:meiotic recombination protein SPO11-like isoform X2 [Hylaeus volcanicus]|uniref:meiotic recombination protein SPO11-like isoform X2 n=1 Tax=Hylaeus volcanicus TaxID=313075 RepID=UPI0023B7F30E|nr:meiotic recombination protein SPO11-like isoform X2 [Hylaeus volcanicus]
MSSVMLNTLPMTNRLNNCFASHGKVCGRLLLKRSASVREVYYRMSHRVKNQQVISRLLKGMCSTLGCSRHDLGLRVSEKGLVFGNLQFNYKSETLSCATHISGRLISELFCQITDISAPKNAIILIVEKEAIFQSLVEDLWNHNESLFILITGRGYPDIITRRFINHLLSILNPPTYYLGDYDPHGIGIYLVYLLGGSDVESQDTGTLAIHWLGLHYKDVQNLPSRVFSSISQKEKKLLDNFLKNPRLNGFPKIQKELHIMNEIQLKCELEALHMFGSKYLLSSIIAKKIYAKEILM